MSWKGWILLIVCMFIVHLGVSQCAKEHQAKSDLKVVKVLKGISF
jgi:hypothetical protein